MATLDTGVWVTLADLKEHLDIDSTDTGKDNFLINVLNAAWKMAVNYIGHDLTTANYVEYYSGDGSENVLLKHYPVNSITSIYIDSLREWAAQTLIDSTDYFFDANTGLVTLFQGQASFQAGLGNVKVSYNAGYSTIPYDAQRGLIILAAWVAMRAGTEGMTMQTLGGKSEQYEAYNIPLYIRQYFVPYKEFSC